MSSIAESDFFSSLTVDSNPVEVKTCLERYFKEKILPSHSSSRQPIFPILLQKTHATILVDGMIKSVSVNDFKRIVDSVVDEIDENISPLALPFGCFMFSVSNGNLNINCYYSERKAEIQYDKGGSIHKYNIPLPNIILSFTLNSIGTGLYQATSIKYFSTDKLVTQLPDNKFIHEPNLDIGVYRLPVSNMYGGNNMCFGRNTMPVRFTNNLRGLDYYYQILTIAPFNSDLGISGLNQSFSPEHWFKHLSKLEKFPYELLKPSTPGDY